MFLGGQTMVRSWALVRLIALLVTLGAIPALADGGIIQPPPPHPPEVVPAAVLNRYQESQSDPAIDTETRIKAAADAYFTLQLMGIVDRCAYDYAFLVDLSSASGQNLYNYEIGRLEFSLAWWKENRVEYVDYQYSPTYEQVQVEGSTAAVAVTVEITLWEPSGSSFSVSVEHDLALVNMTEGWKIAADAYEDPFKKAYPFGTDFAARMPSPGGNDEIPPEVIPEVPDSPVPSWVPIATWTSALVLTLGLGFLVLVRARSRRKRSRGQ